MPRSVFNEDDPLPRQPDAQPRITMSGMGICVQGDIGGVQVALERHIDATADTDALNDALDTMTSAFWRQQAKIRLVEALVDVQSRRDTLAQLPGRIETYRKQRTAERERLEAKFRIAWNVAGKRTAYNPSRSDEQNLTAFDEETRNKLEEFNRLKGQTEFELPLYEKQILRQRAIIAGADRSEVIEEPLPLAAE